MLFQVQYGRMALSRDQHFIMSLVIIKQSTFTRVFQSARFFFQIAKTLRQDRVTILIKINNLVTFIHLTHVIMLIPGTQQWGLGNLYQGRTVYIGPCMISTNSFIIFSYLWL